MAYNTLTPDEERVIVYKGTERPFSGEFEEFGEVGTFVCRRCNAPLYESVHKFDARCGWPSFDKAVEGAVHESLDAGDKVVWELSVTAELGKHDGEWRVDRSRHETVQGAAPR